MNGRITEAALRAEVRAWVGEHWDPALSLRAWRTLLLDAGWAVPSWPERWYGKGLPAWADDVVRRELAACREQPRRERVALVYGRGPLLRHHDPLTTEPVAGAALSALTRERRCRVHRLRPRTMTPAPRATSARLPMNRFP